MVGWSCLVAVALTAGACSRASSVVNANPVEIDASEYARMFRAADRVLRDEGFAIVRQDYRMGVVSTQALHAPTVLEPWRTSNTTPDQAMNATFNSQRRLARIQFEPASGTDPRQLAADPAAATRPAASSDPAVPAGAGTYLLRVEVQLEQGQFPTRRLSGSTEGGRIYNRFAATPADMAQRGITGPHWRAMGRDEALEQRLIAQILRRSIDLP